MEVVVAVAVVIAYLNLFLSLSFSLSISVCVCVSLSPPLFVFFWVGQLHLQGQLKLVLRRVQLFECVRPVVSSHDVMLKAGVQLKLIWDPDVPLYAKVDSTRLRQIISNGLTNAIKFTDTGVIYVHVMVDPEATAELQKQKAKATRSRARVGPCKLRRRPQPPGKQRGQRSGPRRRCGCGCRCRCGSGCRR